MSNDEDRQAFVDLLWERHYPMCMRLAARARASGWDVPDGPARVLFTGTRETGTHVVVVGEQFSEPILDGTEDLEEELYRVYSRLLKKAGVHRDDRRRVY